MSASPCLSLVIQTWRRGWCEIVECGVWRRSRSGVAARGARCSLARSAQSRRKPRRPPLSSGSAALARLSALVLYNTSRAYALNYLEASLALDRTTEPLNQRPTEHLQP